MKAKKIIIAVSLAEETQKPFLYLKEMPIPQDAEIQLIHMVTENVYADGFEFALTYPSKAEKQKLEEQIMLKLQSIKNDLLPRHMKVTTKVIFDTNIRAAFTDYVSKEKADLVIVATRGRHGIKDFFDSSFAQHQVKYSPANVLVLR